MAKTKYHDEERRRLQKGSEKAEGEREQQQKVGIACGGVDGRFQIRTLQSFCRALREHPQVASWNSNHSTHFALHLFLGRLNVGTVQFSTYCRGCISVSGL